jgi:hypothetical protein
LANLQVVVESAPKEKKLTPAFSAPVRDAAIHQLRDWRTALVQAKCSINWPYGHDAAIERDPGTGSVTLTKRFMDHAAVYDNWSVGTSFLDVFPEVAGHIRVHDT